MLLNIYIGKLFNKEQEMVVTKGSSYLVGYLFLSIMALLVGVRKVQMIAVIF